MEILFLYLLHYSNLIFFPLFFYVLIFNDLWMKYDQDKFLRDFMSFVSICF